MGAEQLRAWEVILTSPVAVALLLLLAVFVLAWVLLTWVRGVWAENRQLHQWIREHLESEAGVARALADVRPILELIGDAREEVAASPGALGRSARPGVAGPEAVARAAGRGAEAGDGVAPPVPRVGP